jgi:hypothetical protein
MWALSESCVYGCFLQRLTDVILAIPVDKGRTTAMKFLMKERGEREEDERE